MSHPSYSDFVHINADNAAFAVSLREEDPDALIKKVLPLMVNVPGIKKERIIRKKEDEKINEADVCVKPECSNNRMVYMELTKEVETTAKNIRNLESRLAANRNKQALTERSIQMAEGQREMLSTQIEDIQARISSMQLIVERTEERNVAQRTQLQSLNLNVSTLKEEEARCNREVQALLASRDGPSLIFPDQKTVRSTRSSMSHKKHLHFMQEVNDVRSLDQTSAEGLGTVESDEEAFYT